MGSQPAWGFSLAEMRFPDDPEARRLWEQLPDEDPGGRAEALQHPKELRFHLFTDVKIYHRDPQWSDYDTERWGTVGFGGVLFNAEGAPIWEAGAVLPEPAGVNEAELRAILWALISVRSFFKHKTDDKVVIVHTDNSVAWGAIRHKEANQMKILRATRIVHRAAGSFRAVYYVKEVAANKGIRHAETLATKAVSKETGAVFTWRGSKGNRSNEEPGWDPWEGDDSWV